MTDPDAGAPTGRYRVQTMQDASGGTTWYVEDTACNTVMTGGPGDRGEVLRWDDEATARAVAERLERGEPLDIEHRWASMF